jgi:hypothetical protein
MGTIKDAGFFEYYDMNVSGAVTPNYGFSFYQAAHDIEIWNLTIDGPATQLEFNNGNYDIEVQNITLIGGSIGCNLNNHNITYHNIVFDDDDAPHWLLVSSFGMAYGGPNYDIDMHDIVWSCAPSPTNPAFAAASAIRFHGENSTFHNITMTGKHVNGISSGAIWDHVERGIYYYMKNVTFSSISMTSGDIGIRGQNWTNNNFMDIKLVDMQEYDIALNGGNNHGNKFTNISCNGTTGNCRVGINNTHDIYDYGNWLNLRILNGTSWTLKVNTSGGDTILSGTGNLTKGRANIFNQTSAAKTNYTQGLNRAYLTVNGLAHSKRYNYTRMGTYGGYFNTSAAGVGTARFEVNESEDLTTFAMIYDGANGSGNSAPAIGSILPANETESIPSSNIISAVVTDAEGDTMNCSFVNAMTGAIMQTNHTVASGTNLTYTWSGHTIGSDYYWTMNCTDGTDTTTTGNMTFQASWFIVTQNSLPNAATINSASTTMRYTVNGTETTYSCGLYLDTVLVASNATTANNTQTPLNTGAFPQGLHSWYVTCTADGYSYTSPTRTFTYTVSGGGSGGGGGGGSTPTTTLTATPTPTIPTTTAGGTCFGFPETYLGKESDDWTNIGKLAFCTYTANGNVYGNGLQGGVLLILILLLIWMYVRNQNKKQRRKNKQ